jgi:diguanylate cyclase
MFSKLPEEVVKVHEKSLRLLDESQEQVKHVSEMLRKAVVRLSSAARRDDDHLNHVLDEIKSTVTDNIDLDQLGEKLDRLLVETNRTESGSQTVPTQNFGSILQLDVARLGFSARAEPYKNRIQGLIEKQMSDSEISVALLELVNDIVNESVQNDPYSDPTRTEVKSFADEIRSALSLNLEVNDDSSVSAILEELADDVADYAQKRDVKEHNKLVGIVTDGNSEAKSISEALIVLLNTVNLPESTRQDHQSICRQLDGQLEGAEQWKSVINDIAALINKSISSLQGEKKELETFIKKFTDQLAEIDHYVRESRQQSIVKAHESTKLKDSVDDNVVAIQETVDSADNIAQLKNDVQGHLSQIRKRVEEHQLSDIKREEISKQGYSHIINELARTQKETELLKEQLQESQRKMLRDPLTGLPNRLAYEERIALEVNRSMRNKAPFCLAMWDIDHFKHINDTYGHDAGDRVLKLLAKIIVDRVRKVDLFARIGGEEFVLLMPDTPINHALDLNNELRKSLEASGFHYKGSPCQVTSSVGIASYDENDTSEQLLQKADTALYQSKREGRNRCSVYQKAGQM